MGKDKEASVGQSKERVVKGSRRKDRRYICFLFISGGKRSSDGSLHPDRTPTAHHKVTLQSAASHTPLPPASPAPHTPHLPLPLPTRLIIDFSMTTLFSAMVSERNMCGRERGVGEGENWWGRGGKDESLFSW